MYLELIEVYRWYIATHKMINTFQVLSSQIVHLLNRGVLLFLKFLVQSVCIVFIKPDKSLLISISALYLAQTATRCLQYHVLRTSALLRQNNTRKTLAVPALFTYLRQQDNLYLRYFSIERFKSSLRFSWHRIFFVSAMIAQNCLGWV